MTLRIVLTVAVAALVAACSPAPTVQGDRQAAAVEYATVEAPVASARVASPLTVSGAAPTAWFHDDQFDAILLGDDGTVYGQTSAHAPAHWSGQGPTPFTAQFAFTVSADTPATVILQEQSIGDDQEEPLEVRVPVMLTPQGAPAGG
jgi:hypothetical protein